MSLCSGPALLMDKLASYQTEILFFSEQCKYIFFPSRIVSLFWNLGPFNKGGGKGKLKAMKHFINLRKSTLAHGHKVSVPSARAWEEVSF